MTPRNGATVTFGFFSSLMESSVPLGRNEVPLVEAGGTQPPFLLPMASRLVVIEEVEPAHLEWAVIRRNSACRWQRFVDHHVQAILAVHRSVSRGHTVSHGAFLAVAGTSWAGETISGSGSFSSTLGKNSGPVRIPVHFAAVWRPVPCRRFGMFVLRHGRRPCTRSNRCTNSCPPPCPQPCESQPELTRLGLSRSLAGFFGQLRIVQRPDASKARYSAGMVRIHAHRFWRNRAWPCTRLPCPHGSGRHRAPSSA